MSRILGSDEEKAVRGPTHQIGFRPPFLQLADHLRSRTEFAVASDVMFRDLSRVETEALLVRNRVGRLAFSYHDRVDIQPIHYVYERGWIYGRTVNGEKTATLEQNRWVAFEVDEVDDIFSWRSVVVHGSFWLILPDSPHAEEVWTRARDLVSRIVPGALTGRDLVPFRQLLFRIAVADATGREARTKSFDEIDRHSAHPDNLYEGAERCRGT